MSENNLSSAISLSDNLNETISLSDRFGLWIGFHNIDQNMYLNIIEKYLIIGNIYDYKYTSWFLAGKAKTQL